MMRLVQLFGALTILAFLSACSGTVTKNFWTVPEFQRPIQKVYIVGISRDDSHRRLLEDALQQRLEAQGLPAVASYHDLSENHQEDQRHILKGMTDNACDVVIMVKLTGTKTESVQIPGTIFAPESGYKNDYYYKNWSNYYSHGYRTVVKHPRLEEYQLALMEAVMYDLFTNELFGFGHLESLVEDNVNKMMFDLAERLGKELEREGLI